MGIIYNYLDESERTFLQQTTFASSTSDFWTSDGSLAVNAVTYLDASRGSLELMPSALENYVYYNYFSSASETPSQYAITVEQDAGDFVEAFMWVRPTKNCSIHLKTVLSEVEFDENTSTFSFVDPFVQVIGGEGSAVVALGGTDTPKWQLIRSVPVQVPENGRWSIQLQFRVVFSTLTDAHLHIARPTAHQSKRIFSNGFLSSSFEYFPEIFLESDLADFTKNEPTYPLARIFDVMTTTSDEILDQFTAFEYLDRSEGGDPSNLATLSRLVNPQVCDSAYLSWLAQFRGRPILVTYQPSTEGIGWQIFTLNSSLLDGPDVLGSDATNLGGLPAGLDAFARWQVQTGYYGHNAGTIEAMTSAIQRNLTGSKVVNYTIGLNQIDFTTSQAETFGTVVEDVGSSNSIILSLIEPARPLGMIVTHTLTA